MFNQRTTRHRSQINSDSDFCLFEDDIFDFPAMDDIVLRMLETFDTNTKGSQLTHTTELQLTKREADEGVCFPFNVPILQTCPICGGRGEVWTEDCGVCAGSGGGILSHRLELDVPPGVRNGSCLTFLVAPPFADKTSVKVKIEIS